MSPDGSAWPADTGGPGGTDSKVSVSPPGFAACKHPQSFLSKVPNLLIETFPHGKRMSWTRDGAAGTAPCTRKRGKACAVVRGAARPDGKYQPAPAPPWAHCGPHATGQPHQDTAPAEAGTKPRTSHSTNHPPTADPVSATASGTAIRLGGLEKGRRGTSGKLGTVDGFFPGIAL